MFCIRAFLLLSQREGWPWCGAFDGLCAVVVFGKRKGELIDNDIVVAGQLALTGTHEAASHVAEQISFPLHIGGVPAVQGQVDDLRQVEEVQPFLPELYLLQVADITVRGKADLYGKAAGTEAYQVAALFVLEGKAADQRTGKFERRLIYVELLHIGSDHWEVAFICIVFLILQALLDGEV